MRKTLNSTAVAFVVFLGSLTLAIAGQKTDFALLDETGTDVNVQCGVRGFFSTAVPFTYYVAMANFGADGVIKVIYKDGDFVRYPIKAGASFSFTQAAGGTVGVDDKITVKGAEGAKLAGAISILTDSASVAHPDLVIPGKNGLCITNGTIIP